MEMKHSLHLSQTQKLIMTPRLQQALKLLQVPTLELQQMLKQEILQNPLLEEVDEVTEQEDLEREESADEQNNEEAEDTAAEDLPDQLHFLNLPRESMHIAEFLVGSIDDRGWLVTPMDEIVDSLQVSREDVEKVLRVVQALEPGGVGARDLG